MNKSSAPALATRFRGFLPVVIDLETGGFNSATDALLELAVVFLQMEDQGSLALKNSLSYHVKPFAGANIESASLAITGIDPYHPLRPALSEDEVLKRIFQEVRRELRETGCHRAILVGHNAHFDLGFLNAAILRTRIKRNPFHPFSCFDTVTLAGLAYGQTVLSKAAAAAGLPFDPASAHSARYDAECTAQLFCRIVNLWQGIFMAQTQDWADLEDDADADLALD